MQDLSQTSVHIIKLQVLIYITTFSDWKFTQKIIIFDYFLNYYYWLFPNSISRINIKKV